MKPVPFNYLCAYSLEEALHHLRSSDDGKLVELDFIREDGEDIVIGALTRHNTVAKSELVEKYLPVMYEAVKHVAHLAVRNRGTIGGSLSQADPAAEYPMLSLLLDAKISCESLD